MTPPLAGRRVLLVRPADEGRVEDRLLAALRAAGAQSVAVASTRFAPPADEAALARARAELSAGGSWDWAVFTSPRAVTALAPAPTPIWPRLRVAAVGPVTAAALARAGQETELALEAGGAAALGIALAPRLRSGARVLLPMGNLAAVELEAALVVAGAHPRRLEAYRTVPRPLSAADLAALREPSDAIVFTSGSGAESLLACLRDRGRTLPAAALIACLGPRTASDLAALGLRVDVVSQAPGGAALVAALAEALTGAVASPVSPPLALERPPRSVDARHPTPRGT